MPVIPDKDLNYPVIRSVSFPKMSAPGRFYKLVPHRQRKRDKFPVIVADYHTIPCLIVTHVNVNLLIIDT